MISSLDHLVLTATNEDATIEFYVDCLGMRLESFGGGRKAFRFGNQKINLHVRGNELEPKAHLPVPGALDLCFLVDRPLDDVITALGQKGVKIVEGPVERTGASATLRSIYVRDPDLNLIELSERIA